MIDGGHKDGCVAIQTIKTEKAKIQATNAALEADLDLLATKGEAAAAEVEALALEERTGCENIDVWTGAP
jgi:hypothetical protein